MIPHPAPAEPPSPADQAAEDTLYYRGVLHELIDMGADLARAVHRQGMAQAESESAGDEPDAGAVHDAAVAFDRISRCVRRTVALARKLAEPVPARAAGQDRAAARRRIIREVEDVIQREVGGADADALEAELHERLDAPELDDEIDGRPVAEIIADICHDLGLLTFLGNHPWKRRGPAEIAALCARAAQGPGAARADQPGEDPPSAAPSSGGGETWAGPQPYSREASIELMHQLLEHRPPIRGP